MQPTEEGTKIKKVTKVRKQITGTEVQMLFPGDRIEVKEDNLEWGKLTIELARGVPPREFSSPHWYDANSFWVLLDSVKDKTQTIGEVLATIFGPYSVDDFSPDILAMLEKKACNKIDLEDCAKLLHNIENVYPEVKPDELGSVGFLDDFLLREERKGFYMLPSEEKVKKPLRIPYVIELWARPLRGIEKEIFGHRYLNRETRAKVFLFVNKTYVPGDPSVIEDVDNSVRLCEDFINFRGTVKDLLKKHCILYLNITTPFIQTAMDSKKPILPEGIINILEEMFLSIFKQVNSEKRFHKARDRASIKKDRSEQRREIKPESAEVVSIYNSTTNCIEDFLRNERIDFEKGKSHKSEYLQVLSEDPFVTGIKKAQIKRAIWFKTWWSKFNPERNRKHLRRFYYWAISQPDGTVITHDEKDFKTRSPANAWDYVLDSSKFARNLQLVDPFEIIDRRNPEPLGEIRRRLEFHNEISPANWTFPYGRLSIPKTTFLSPELIINEELAIQTSSALQPVHLEIWTEKTTMNDILEPLCEEYGIRLVPYAGYASITSIDKFVETAVSFSDKPSVIFYISDFDPAGQNMPVTVARYLQHRIWVLKNKNLWPEKKEIFINHVLLTKAQMESDEFKTLPKAPAGKKKKDEDYYSDTRPGTVELDALEALMEGKFKEIVLEHIAKVFDMEIAEKARQEIVRIKEYFHSTMRDHLKPSKGSIIKIEKNINSIRKRYERDFNSLFKNMLKEIKPFVKRGVSIKEKTNKFCKELESELKPDIRIEKNPELGACLFDSNQPFKDQTELLQDYRTFKIKKGEKGQK